ncbi:unnamed protein product, partial [marine sediment metagenome]
MDIHLGFGIIAGLKLHAYQVYKVKVDYLHAISVDKGLQHRVIGKLTSGVGYGDPFKDNRYRPQVARTMRNGNFTKTGIVCLALLLALGAMGVGYAQWSDTVFISGTVETGEFSSGFIACSTNDPPNTIDPGKDKDVGSATAELASPENDGWEEVVVTITNAYPCYQCQVYVTVQNHGTVPAQIDTVTITSPPEVTVTDIDALIGVVLDPGETVDGTVSVHLEQSAAQCHSYIFTIEIPGILWCLGGSQGMWKNWDNHYEAEEVNAWLQAIDTASPNHPDDWLVPELDGIPGISVGDLNEIYE